MEEILYGGKKDTNLKDILLGTDKTTTFNTYKGINIYFKDTENNKILLTNACWLISVIYPLYYNTDFKTDIKGLNKNIFQTLNTIFKAIDNLESEVTLSSFNDIVELSDDAKYTKNGNFASSPNTLNFIFNKFYDELIKHKEYNILGKYLTNSIISGSTKNKYKLMRNILTTFPHEIPNEIYIWGNKYFYLEYNPISAQTINVKTFLETLHNNMIKRDFKIKGFILGFSNHYVYYHNDTNNKLIYDTLGIHSDNILNCEVLNIIIWGEYTISNKIKYIEYDKNLINHSKNPKIQDTNHGNYIISSHQLIINKSPDIYIEFESENEELLKILGFYMDASTNINYDKFTHSIGLPKDIFHNNESYISILFKTIMDLYYTISTNSKECERIKKIYNAYSIDKMKGRNPNPSSSRKENDTIIKILKSLSNNDINSIIDKLKNTDDNTYLSLFGRIIYFMDNNTTNIDLYSRIFYILFYSYIIKNQNIDLLFNTIKEKIENSNNKNILYKKIIKQFYYLEPIFLVYYDNTKTHLNVNTYMEYKMKGYYSKILEYFSLFILDNITDDNIKTDLLNLIIS